MKKKGLLIVISGPSGIGKSTIRERLVKENDDFWYSISMTTRRPRKIEKTNMYEQDGVDYYFVDEDDFVKNIKEDNFLVYIQALLKNEVLRILIRHFYNFFLLV